MPVEKIEGGGAVITGDSIEMFRLRAMEKGLKLEMSGMTRSRGMQTMYARIKKEFGFNGNKRKVHEQFCRHIERLENEHNKQNED